MDLFALATQVGTALAGTGLRVYPYGGQHIEAPAAVVTMPGEYTASSYGRGARHVSGLGVLVCVRSISAGRPQRATLKQLYGYCAETGTSSVVKAVEDYAYTACVPGTMVWTKTTFDTVKIADVDYLSALLEFDADGVAS